MKTIRVQDAKVGQLVRHNGTDVEIVSIIKRGATFSFTFSNNGFRSCSWGAILTIAA